LLLKRKSNLSETFLATRITQTHISSMHLRFTFQDQNPDIAF
jgi:hypothetical protein